MKQLSRFALVWGFLLMLAVAFLPTGVGDDGSMAESPPGIELTQEQGIITVAALEDANTSSGVMHPTVFTDLYKPVNINQPGLLETAHYTETQSIDNFTNQDKDAVTGRVALNYILADGATVGTLGKIEIVDVGDRLILAERYRQN